MLLYQYYFFRDVSQISAELDRRGRAFKTLQDFYSASGFSFSTSLWHYSNGMLGSLTYDLESMLETTRGYELLPEVASKVIHFVSEEAPPFLEFLRGVLGLPLLNLPVYVYSTEDHCFLVTLRGSRTSFQLDSSKALESLKASDFWKFFD